MEPAIRPFAPVAYLGRTASAARRAGWARVSRETAAPPVQLSS